MQNLSIKMPGKSISIDMNGGNLSIDMESGVASSQTTARLEWSHTLLDGDTVTQADAEKEVAKLGDGWRLPAVEELSALVDRSRHDPAIDTEKYPDTRSRAYWTSTPCAFDDAAVWVVGFDSGGVYGYHRSSSACVRAVRAGQ